MVQQGGAGRPRAGDCSSSVALQVVLQSGSATATPAQTQPDPPQVPGYRGVVRNCRLCNCSLH